MITVKVGNLITSALNKEYDIIGHGSNCFHKMSSGIAKNIKESFPEAYDVDLKTNFGDTLKLGSVSYTENTIPIIVNIYSQYK